MPFILIVGIVITLVFAIASVNSKRECEICRK